MLFSSDAYQRRKAFSFIRSQLHPLWGILSFSFPRSHKCLSHHWPSYSLFTMSAYFRVVVSIGTFYCADEQCWTARWNVWSTVISFFSSSSFKFSSGHLEMKVQDVKSYGGLILFLYLLSLWVKNVIEDVTHHTETQIMDVAKHNPLQILKEHIQPSLGFKVSKYCSLKTWNFDPWTWRSDNPTVSSTDQELWPPSCPPMLLKSKNQPKDGNEVSPDFNWP